MERVTFAMHTGFVWAGSLSIRLSRIAVGIAWGQVPHFNIYDASAESQIELREQLLDGEFVVIRNRFQDTTQQGVGFQRTTTSLSRSHFP